MGCVSHRILQLYARWRSPWQETILRRSAFMHALNGAWSSSLRVRRLSNDTPLPRTKSWRWLHRPRPPPPPHCSAPIATKKPSDTAGYHDLGLPNESSATSVILSTARTWVTRGVKVFLEAMAHRQARTDAMINMVRSRAPVVRRRSLILSAIAR